MALRMAFSSASAQRGCPHQRAPSRPGWTRRASGSSRHPPPGSGAVINSLARLSQGPLDKFSALEQSHHSPEQLNVP